MRRTAILAVVVALGAGLLAGCAKDSEEPGGSAYDSGGGKGRTTITVGVFGAFGLKEAGLYEEYMKLHPDIRIKQTSIQRNENYYPQLLTHLSTGSGLADIQAVEVNNIAEVTATQADRLVDLGRTDGVSKDSFLDWKWAQATTKDGKTVGLGTDIGPQGICYRKDLFEKAGLPTDREEVAGLMGTWEDYFATGEEFVSKVPGTAWYDSTGGTAQAMLNQIENPFEQSDNTIDVENAEIQALYATLTENVDKGLSTKLTQWSEDWTASFQKDGFATMACPGWMLGVVSGNADGVAGWDFANVFPGGGGNWGGSFLVVPKQSEHPEEAQEFAAWITAPEQQVKAFQAIGAFPSQVDALESPEVLEMTNEFFNNAPVGQILSDRAAAITVQPYKGPKYSDILQAFQAALIRVDDGSNTPDESWETFLSDVDQLS
jgi:cellobiose transport system substrate-binding protein